jgi:hypothetical protein
MAFNFPDSPTDGQVFNQWTWSAATGAWKLTPPPAYTAAEADARFVNVSGDTMTGHLSLPITPTNPNAVRKDYVDAAIAAIPPAVFFPAGTVMLFYQAAAPTGWTTVTTHNNKALRVVSSGGGASGGTNAFSTVFAQTVTGNHTNSAATQTNMNVGVSGTVTVYPLANSGYYYHIIAGGNALSQDVWGGNPSYSNYVCYFYQAAGTQSYYMQAGNSMAGATNNGSGGAHNHTITMAIQYIDIILASKN